MGQTKQLDLNSLRINNIEIDSLYDAIQKPSDFDENLPALRYFGMEISYKDLFSNIEKNQRALSGYGVGKGDVIACALPTCPESIYLFYAANKLGVIVQWIDVRITTAEMLRVFRKSRPKLLFIMSFIIKNTPSIQKLPCESVIILRGCDAFPQHVQFWFKLGERLNGRRVQSKRKGFIYYSEFISKEGEFPSNESCLSTADDIACIFPSSGTTGTPKYIKISNKAINFTVNTGTLIDPAVGDIVLNVIPCFTGIGLIWNIHCPLSKGMTIDIVPHLKIKSFQRILVKSKPNHVFGVPSYWQFVLSQKRSKAHDLSSIKTVIVAGERMGIGFEKTVNEYLKANGASHSICVAYGMTESACIGCLRSYFSEESEGSVGFPHANVEVKIVDDNMMELPHHQNGEICIHTPFLTSGYLDNEEETARLLKNHSDGKIWIHTGDIGYMSEKGEVFVVGRLKKMLVLESGSKVFPSEIEKVILKYPHVLDCAVKGVKTKGNWVDGLVVYVVVEKKSISVSNYISRKCREDLSAYCVPSDIKVVDELPRTPSGKINYSALPD